MNVVGSRVGSSKTLECVNWGGGGVAHQKGPDTPYFQATFEDCSRVAAQVQWLTMSTAMRPVLMVRPAQLNCSEDVRVPPNLRESQQFHQQHINRCHVT